VARNRRATLDLISRNDARPSIERSTPRPESFFFLIAGHETTVVGISYLLWRLALNPDQRKRLINDPSLIPAWSTSTTPGSGACRARAR
jgi:cytochrome P450